MKASRALWLLASLVVVIATGFAWQKVAEARLISPVFLPGPERTWAALVHGLVEGDLWARWLGTLKHMFLGWLLASVAGILIGAVIGSSSRTRAYLGPTLEFMRPLPASAVVPLAISLLGLSQSMVLTVIAFGAVWPMLLATVHGFSAVEPRLYEVSKALGLSRLEQIYKISLPSSLPDILSGMRVGLTVALILAVVGEMLASQQGLGEQLLLAARSFRAPDLYAGVILLGVTGYATAVVLNLIEVKLLKWQQSR